MNCPFNKMNDEDFLKKLNAQSSQPELDTQYFTPLEYSSKKSCACSAGNSPNLQQMSETNGGLKGKTGEIFDSIMKMLKNVAGERDIYKAVSVYEFYISVAMIIVILSTQNLYLGLLLLGLYSRQIPEIIIKLLLSGKDGELREWAKRPEGARDCNMFNSGGDMSKDSGIVSSHTFLISTIIFYFIFKFTNNFTNQMNYKQYIFIILLILWTIIVVLARVRLGCHKMHQTITGIVMGIGWGYLLYLVIEKLKNSTPRILEDEEKVMKFFEVKNN
jgi:membrane-associated phospholipid phosphatase